MLQTSASDLKMWTVETEVTVGAIFQPLPASFFKHLSYEQNLVSLRCLGPEH